MSDLEGNRILNAALYNLIGGAPTKDNLYLAYYLIKAGADPNLRGKNNITILFTAVASNNIEMVEKLVSIGCDVNVYDRYGNNPIDLACDNYFNDLVDWFLNHGVDINQNICNSSCNKEKRIHSICRPAYTFQSDPEKISKAINLVKVFLKHGANLLEENNETDGWTPLYYATYEMKGKMKEEMKGEMKKKNQFVKFIKEETEKQEKQREEKLKNASINLFKEIEEMMKQKAILKEQIKKLEEAIDQYNY